MLFSLPKTQKDVFEIVIRLGEKLKRPPFPGEVVAETRLSSNTVYGALRALVKAGYLRKGSSNTRASYIVLRKI